MRVILTLIIAFISSFAFGQKNLDLEKNRTSELFKEKKEYTIPSRLDEIERYMGQVVTVYKISGKSHKIKDEYTGILGMSVYDGISDKQKASIITVTCKSANNVNKVYFPLTNSKKYRIYLTSKMK